MGDSARAIYSVAVDQQVGHASFGLDGPPAWQVDTAVLLLACAAALFVVAGVIRLARWRLAGDQHSALVGSALVVMGGLYLPLVGVAAVGGALQHREFADAVIRALVSFIAAGLVLRALYATTMRSLDRPSRLLPALAATILCTFGVLVAVEASMEDPLPYGPWLAKVLSGAMVVGWLLLMAAVRARNLGLPWSGRAVPLCAGLAVAEACYGLGSGAFGTTLGTAASLVACTAVAILAVYSAHLDLAATLVQTERAFGSLSRALRDAYGEAVELSHWRASLVHDADNAVAGLRAALDVIDARQGSSDSSTARLCRAASDEVSHLDHLLHRSPEEPCRAFDVGSSLLAIGESARALGTDITVRAEKVVAVGRPADVIAVVKNLLANARRHAHGAAVRLSVESTDGVVRIVCADDGPGLDEITARHAFERGFRGPDSAGSGLGLHDARALMRAQGGDLFLEPQGEGARFVAILPESVRLIPAQRVDRPIVPAADPIAQPS
jgi:hypothetical protein